ncbi:hypothetical protein [Photobacterium sanguinicancri]|uniref:hypothetical protein n=2 Tax=Photobacterium sanguinicancri TaxID=875932 RepID=UPI002480A882|nr:hypothetical protein [Photobacterium sanguinicancri]
MKTIFLVTISILTLVGCGGSNNSQGESSSGGRPISPLVPPSPKPPTAPVLPEKPEEHCSINNIYREQKQENPQLIQYLTTMTVNKCNNVDHEKMTLPRVNTDSSINNAYELNYYSAVSEYDTSGQPKVYSGYSMFRTYRNGGDSFGAEIWPMKMTTSTKTEIPADALSLGASKCEFSANLDLEALVINGQFNSFRNTKRGGLASFICFDDNNQTIYSVNGEIYFTSAGEYDTAHPSYNEILATNWSLYGFQAFRNKFANANLFASPSE